MKLNKKILIPVLSTALGLSIIGGITGVIAWYQYNSKVNTSFLGTSVADTGVLQLGVMEKVFKEDGSPDYVDDSAPEPVQKQTIVWGREFSKPDADHLIPVTFGALQKIEEDELDGEGLPTGNKIVRHILPKTAYSYPESGCGEGYVGHTHNDDLGRNCNIPGWVVANEGKDYAEFELYFRAVQTDNNQGFKQVVRDVFLSNYIFDSVVEDKNAHEALRVYVEVNDGYDGSFIMAENEYKDLNDYNAENFEYDANLDGRLDLFGPLNLDKSNQKDANPNASENDVYHGTLWNDYLKSYGVHNANWPKEHKLLPKDNPEDPDVYEDVVVAGTPFKEGEEIYYGNYGDKQATKKISSLKQERKADGSMPKSNEADYSKRLFSTKADEAVKVRIVVWLEGWEYIKVNADNGKAREWNPALTAGTKVQVGLQFDTGIFRGSDLNA